MSTRRRPLSPREKPRAQSGHFALFDVPTLPINIAMSGRYAYMPYRSWHVGIFTRRVDLSHRPAEPPLLFFSTAKIEIYFPQARPILLSNFSSSPSFSDTVDSHIHIAIRSREYAGEFVIRLVIVISAFKSLRFWSFQGFGPFYIRRFLLFYFMCRSLHVPQILLRSLRSLDPRYILELSQGYVLRKCSG